MKKCVYNINIEKGFKKAVLVHMAIVTCDLWLPQNCREYGLFYHKFPLYYIGVIDFIVSAMIRQGWKQNYIAPIL